MRNVFKLVNAALALVIILSACGGPSHDLTGDAGFEWAAFDDTDLRVLMGEEGCTTVRFYNVLRKEGDTEGSVMAVAVDALGREIGGGASGMPYRIYDKVVDRLTETIDTERTGAVKASQWLRDAGHKAFAAELGVKALVVLLRNKECNGIRITPSTLSDGSLTMRFTAAKLGSGSCEELPAVPGSVVVCGEPCPAYCSEDVEYVHM
ncbi:MAG: hypothetical protein ACK46G_03995 [Flavobacteriales bacterium]|jgi:hypothetical protein